MSDAQISLADQELSWFWDDVSSDVSTVLTAEQKKNIEAAVKRSAATTDHADLKLSLGRFYVRIVAGKERRGHDRIEKEGGANPVFAKKNLLVIGIYWILMLFAILYVWSLFKELVYPILSQ